MPSSLASFTTFCILATLACSTLALDFDGDFQPDVLQPGNNAADCNHNGFMDNIDMQRPHFTVGVECLTGSRPFQNDTSLFDPCDIGSVLTPQQSPMRVVAPCSAALALHGNAAFARSCWVVRWQRTYCDGLDNFCHTSEVKDCKRLNSNCNSCDVNNPQVIHQLFTSKYYAYLMYECADAPNHGRNSVRVEPSPAHLGPHECVASTTNAHVVIHYTDTNSTRERRVAASLKAAGFEVVVRAATQRHDGADGKLRLTLLGLDSYLNETRASATTSAPSDSNSGIAFAQGMHLWPLAEKARLLLSGFTKLVDTARDELADISSAVTSLSAELLEAHTNRLAVSARLLQVGFVGTSPIMSEVGGSILHIAKVGSLPVLLTGETGTGKERAARALHACDPLRCTHNFVPVNCAAIPEQLAESELFGHRRGSFTGAGETRGGLFREAHQGVLFLDEIGELSLPVQAKLLRVLQDSAVRGVGEQREHPINVRVIAATNRDLPTMISKGQFRSDLFYRLSVLTLNLPPLRGRPDDIRALSDHFCRIHALECGHTEPAVPSPEFLDVVNALPLPGNARELENIIRHALIRTPGATLGIEHFPREVISALCKVPPPQRLADAPQPHLMYRSEPIEPVTHQSPEDLNLTRAVQAAERRTIVAAMRRASNNRTKAARLLGISARCMYNKLRTLGMDEPSA